MNEFYGVNSLNDNFLIENLEENIKSFFDYNLTRIGGFVNVDANLPTSGLYDNSFANFRPIRDISYGDNLVWQAPRNNWVYESGISYGASPAIEFSGVYVDDNFHPAPSGDNTRSYTVNYLDGQIIFNKKVYDGSQVKASYSYKWCSVLKTSDDRWNLIKKRTYEPQKISKDKEILGENNLQLPAIFIEFVPRNYDIPYELGTLKSYRNQDLLIHIYTENISDQNKLIDIVRLQKENCLFLYDIRDVVKNGVNKLKHDGSLNSFGLDYIDIVSNDSYRWNKTYIKNIALIDQQKNADSSIMWCMLRITCETIL